LTEHEIPRDRRKVGTDAAAESGAVVMNGPLGDETKMNQHLATNVILVGCETEDLEEAYKILMLAGVDLRFSGLTRELQPAVWTRIRQRVARLFSTGQHRKATKVLIRHIIAVNPDVDREKMTRSDVDRWKSGRRFDKEYLLVDWNLCGCKISVLPRSFSALVCTGDLELNCNQLRSLPADFGQLEVGGYLQLNANQLESLPADFGQLQVGGFLSLDHNQLGSLPADFGQLKVGGNLWLNDNQLDSLPEGFENISVGGKLHLYNNQLVEQSCSFPNVRGEVVFADPRNDY